MYTGLQNIKEMLHCFTFFMFRHLKRFYTQTGVAKQNKPVVLKKIKKNSGLMYPKCIQNKICSQQKHKSTYVLVLNAVTF